MITYVYIILLSYSKSNLIESSQIYLDTMYSFGIEKGEREIHLCLQSVC